MKKLYYLLEFEEINLVMTLSGVMKWIKNDVGDLERECPQTYKVTPIWLTKDAFNALKEADI